ARGGKLERAWSTRTRVLHRTRAPIRFVVNLTANANVGEDGFFWRGAAALALAGPLARAGYKVAITGVIAVHGTYDMPVAADYLCGVDVKAYGEPLDTSRLAGVLCTPATLRWLGLRLMCHSPRRLVSGFGHAMHDAAMMTAALRAGVFGHKS